MDNLKGATWSARWTIRDALVSAVVATAGRHERARRANWLEGVEIYSGDLARYRAVLTAHCGYSDEEVDRLEAVGRT